MPTTTVKSANLFIKPSKIAQIIHLITTGVIVWAILISPIPLVVSIYLIGYLFIDFPLKTLSGFFKVTSGRRVELDEFSGELKYTEVLFKPLYIVIHCTNGRKLQVWRDACKDEEYRHLILVLSLLN